MEKFSYHKKFHYLLKYIVIGFPIILLICSLISYSSQYNTILQGVYNLSLDLRNLPINQFYNTFLNVLGFNTITNELTYILLTIPLYIMWVYLLDIVLDVFTLIPKIAHKFIEKLGGAKYE